MIVYLDRDRRSAPPPWLLGAPDLLQTEHRDGHLWGIGDPWLLGPGPWLDLGDGYAVRDAPLDVDDPARTVRAQRWADVVPVFDLHDREWMVPRILTPAGERAFRVAYGPGFLPRLTPDQESALAMATEARTAFESRIELPAHVPMGWAASFLATAHHLTPDVIAQLGILDDRLVVETLRAVCSLPLRLAD